MNRELAHTSRMALGASHDLVRHVCHTVPHTEETERMRDLLEYAGAFLDEAAVAALGRDGRSPERLFQDVSAGMALIRAAHAKEAKP